MGINWYQDNAVVEREITQTPRSEPDLYMINANITQFDKMGQLHHRIRAEKFTHFPLTDITILRMPSVILYSEGTTPWQINAREGQILPGESAVRASSGRTSDTDDIVELWNEVIAEQTRPDGRFIHIRTDFLTIIPADDYAETDRIVTIEDNKSTTTAAGMIAHFRPGRFVFFSNEDQRVNTVIPGKSE